MIKLIPKFFGGKKKKKPKSKVPKKSTPLAKRKKNEAAQKPSTIEQLEAASAALEKAADPEISAEAPKSGKNPTEREKLIQKALSIHREKSKILDNLPPAVRTKLTAMAMALYIQQRSDKDKN